MWWGTWVPGLQIYTAFGSACVNIDTCSANDAALTARPWRLRIVKNTHSCFHCFQCITHKILRFLLAFLNWHNRDKNVAIRTGFTFSSMDQIPLNFSADSNERLDYLSTSAWRQQHPGLLTVMTFRDSSIITWDNRSNPRQSRGEQSPKQLRQSEKPVTVSYSSNCKRCTIYVAIKYDEVHVQHRLEAVCLKFEHELLAELKIKVGDGCTRILTKTSGHRWLLQRITIAQWT